tara:strand:- start:581 stop:1336 length:756 start_codon:yes stop_codon:yes gene_type:complete
MPIFGWMPGADKASIVERELANQDINATRDGFADRVGAWNWQDDIGAWMAGTDKEEVLRLATEKANKDLESKLRPQANANAEALGGVLKPTYTGVDGKTLEELEAELARDADRGRTLESTRAKSPTLKVSGIDPNATSGQILALGGKANTDEADRRTEKERDERIAELRYQEGRTDDRYKAEVLRAERADARARLDRLSARRDTADMNRMNMQLEYARMAQNDLYRQQDKKDKALMLLIQGLQNLGTGFTI